MSYQLILAAVLPLGTKRKRRFIMANTAFTYGGFTGDFDITVAENAERWESAGAQFSKDQEEVLKADRPSAQLRLSMQSVTRMLDTVLGEGAAEKMLNGSKSLSDGFEAFYALLEHVGSQQEAYTSRFKKIYTKYAPNRASRRAKKA
jgi:hypothetical protein